ncbi:hypothetical protein MBLNU230_g5548t1 [Neophaeotheca triangularis]
MPLERKQKNILLTGGAQGIGRATARHLLSLPANHNLYILDIGADELAYCGKTYLSAYAPRVGWSVANLREPSEIRSAVKKAADFLDGRIDVLICNAGIARPHFTAGDGTMEDQATAEEWQAYVETNLSAPFLVSQAVIPFMKAQASSQPGQSGDARHGEDRLEEGGCIVHVSSFRAHMSDANCEGYGATKMGLGGLTQAMAVSGQQWGIRCNMVSPGTVKVGQECREGDERAKELAGGEIGGLPHEGEWEKWRTAVWDETRGEAYDEAHPTGRVGRGEDIAEAIEFVMGAGFVSGQEIVVDGGKSKKKTG